MYCRNIIELTGHESLLDNPSEIAAMRVGLNAGDVYISRQAYDKKFLLEVRDYLVNIGKNSLPNYEPIKANSANSHRLNDYDERAYVKGCFHQFNFYPWNQDVFRLFTMFQEIFYIKNRLLGLPDNKFLTQIDADCTARIGFQFYPSGKGCLNKHQDPKQEHQLTIPILLLSQKGEDFHVGGGFVEQANGEQLIVDDIADIGDVIYINAEVNHGVATIDPDDFHPWLDFKGRWMALFAVNKLQDNQQIQDSVDLGNHNA